MTRVSFRRWAILGSGVVLGALLAGGVVAGQFRAPPDPEGFVAATRDDPVVRIADIASVGKLPARGVFVQATSTGQLCLWDAPSAASLRRQGGCNAADDPLGGRQLSASLSYSGGPATRQVTDARLIGLVSPEVASVELLMSDGTRRDVPMRRAAALSTAAGTFRAFGYRMRPSDLERGVGPTAVVALDAAGKEIDRQTTGFGG